MKLFILSTLICSLIVPVYSENHKKNKTQDFDKIKVMKIEYLNKKLICVNNSKNFKQLKKCWKRRNKKLISIHRV